YWSNIVIVVTYSNEVISSSRVNPSFNYSIYSNFSFQYSIFLVSFIYHSKLIAGFSYDSFFVGHRISIGNIVVQYSSYLAVGVIAFNVMNSCTVSGAIIWVDKRNGMFQQIMTLSFTRIQYVLSNLVAILIMSLASGFLIFLVGLSIFLGDVNFFTYSLFYTVYALLLGTIIFGSIIIIISTTSRNNSRYTLLTILSSYFRASSVLPSFLLKIYHL
ncbi:MAG: hypothetical protein WBP64_12580, partial [Nitrososphaeraceae archaeon]